MRRRSRRPLLFFGLFFALALVTVPLGIMGRAFLREKATHALVVAVYKSDAQDALSALRAGADPNTRQTPEDNPPTLAQFVRQFWRRMRGGKTSGSFDREHHPPLIVVAAENDAEVVVQHLLTFGADPNAPAYRPNRHWNSYPVEWHRTQKFFKDRAIDNAVQNNDLSMAQALIQYHANVDGGDDEDCAPILWARSPEMLALLVRNGANVHAQIPPISTTTEDGMTRIHIAARFGDVKSLAILLDNGVSVNDTYAGNETPLMVAAYSGALNAMRFLVQHGADVNSKAGGKTAPTNACMQGNMDAARWLLAHGADVELRNNDGQTPLLVAVDSVGHTHETAAPMVKVLIQAGANVNVRDNNGETPLRLAIRSKDAQTIAVLRRAGAKQ